IAVFWGRRQEPHEKCADQLMHYFAALREIDDRFVSLHMFGKSFDEPIGSRVPNTTKGIKNLLKADEQFPDLGWRISARTPDDSLRIHARIGCWAKSLPHAN